MAGNVELLHDPWEGQEALFWAIKGNISPLRTRVLGPIQANVLGKVQDFLWGFDLNEAPKIGKSTRIFKSRYSCFFQSPQDKGWIHLRSSSLPSTFYSGITWDRLQAKGLREIQDYEWGLVLRKKATQNRYKYKHFQVAIFIFLKARKAICWTSLRPSRVTETLHEGLQRDYINFKHGRY